jgi:membrane fusion protein, multidrug efflux system
MPLKKFPLWIVLAAIVAAGVLAWWLQQRAPATAVVGRAAPAAAASAGAAGSAAVEVGAVEELRLEDDAQAVGSLRAAQSVMLRPEVSGRIARLGFVDGQRVRRGQWLVQLDDTLQRAQLQQAQAQAAIARTNLQRSRELLAQGFVSASAVDQNAAALAVAQAQVALAQAQLARLTVAAPFDGVVGIRSVDPGDYVKDGADIVSLEDRSRMWVDFRLPERYVGRVRTGLPVQVTLDALPGRTLAATVQALDAQIDADGRSLRVRARIESPPDTLRSGLFARARIVFAVRERALMVPEEALVPQGGRQFIVKAVAPPTPAGASGATSAAPARVSQRIEARIGLRRPGQVEILEGLAPGDWVVTAGQAGVMRDGVRLRIVNVGAAAGGAGQAPAKAATPASRAPAPA